MTDCPFRAEEEVRPSCEICGEPLFEGSDGYSEGERFVCADCVDMLTADELLSLAKLRDMGELLALLGYRRLL